MISIAALMMTGCGERLPEVSESGEFLWRMKGIFGGIPIVCQGKNGLRWKALRKSSNRKKGLHLLHGVADSGRKRKRGEGYLFGEVYQCIAIVFFPPKNAR